MVGDALVFYKPIAHGLDAIEHLPSEFDVGWRLAQLPITLTGSRRYATLARVLRLADEPLQEIRADGFRRGFGVVR